MNNKHTSLHISVSYFLTNTTIIHHLSHLLNAICKDLLGCCCFSRDTITDSPSHDNRYLTHMHTSFTRATQAAVCSKHECLYDTTYTISALRGEDIARIGRYMYTNEQTKDISNGSQGNVPPQYPQRTDRSHPWQYQDGQGI